MERAPTALHRVLAWCVAALFFALVLVGTRRAFRALMPDVEAEAATAERVEPVLADVEDEPERATREGSAAAVVVDPVVQASRSARRAVRPLGEEPMERHAAFVIEGTVRSASGLLQQPVELRVDHPAGGTAPTRLFFDRAAPDGGGRVAPFKLVKPGQGVYVLRPVVVGAFDYAVEPRERRIEDSTSGVHFQVRDDVAHVDLDVLALGTGGEELPAARLHWRVYRGAGYGIEDLIYGGLRAEELERDRGPELHHVPVTNALECLVTSEGYRPHREVIHLFAGQRRLEVQMETGWGIYLVDMGARTRPSHEGPPLGEILLDGRRVGSTDPSGVTYVEGDATPVDFAVLYDGRRAALLRKVPKDRLVVTIDHARLEPEGFVPPAARD